MLMDKNFEIALQFVLKWEGGLVEDKNDPGGLTKYGISQKSYPYEDVKNMTLERAKEIYYQNYWLKSDCDKIPFPMNLIIFDTSVNCGRKRAKELFVNSLGWQDYLFKRIKFYAGLKNFKFFGRGWVNRVIDLYDLVKKTENQF